LPKRRRAWASWNYHIPDGNGQSASVTYDLSRLQNHDSPSPILLTLNATDCINPDKILRTFSYHHPAYSRESISAQRRFKEISGRNRSHFCGAYWGYGFHEDGVNSALAVAKHFGIELDACTVASTKESSRTAVASR
jgi:predicted NAD/FAD-binding protein